MRFENILMRTSDKSAIVFRARFIVALLPLAACHAVSPTTRVEASGDDSITATGLHLHRSADSVRLITSDISHFWRAYDDAMNRDSATRVRIFRDEYFAPASVGLRDFVRLRFVSNRKDASDSVLAEAAAIQFAGVTAAWPRYYAGVRATSLAVDTSAAITTTVRSGLRRLSKLYPAARFPDIYFLVGRASTGGTTSSRGLLLGVEMFSRTASTPVDELPPQLRLGATIFRSGQLGPSAVHEAVHFLQPIVQSDGQPTLLQAALAEGGANFLSELATYPWVHELEYERYGDAHEDMLWRSFRQDMNGTDMHRWLWNYSDADNQGMPDLGYWAGYKIAAAYYARVADKSAAVRDLVLINDADRIWRQSGYDHTP